MIIRHTFWLALFALAAAGCASTPELRMQADPPINLASYNSYQWTDAAAPADAALSDRARASVARRLGARGLASRAPGDIAVAVSLDAQKRQDVTDFGDAFFIPGHGPHPGIHVPGAYPRYDVENYTEGQLAIDIYDARSQRLIWRGQAAGRVDPESDEDIDRMVAALLTRAAD